MNAARRRGGTGPPKMVSRRADVNRFVAKAPYPPLGGCTPSVPGDREECHPRLRYRSSWGGAPNTKIALPLLALLKKARFSRRITELGHVWVHRAVQVRKKMDRGFGIQRLS